MYIILVYDVSIKRNSKIMKICRKYLFHVQKSVFEGKITEAKLKSLKKEIKKICKDEENSIMIYEFDSLKYSTKEIIGTYTQHENIL